MSNHTITHASAQAFDGMSLTQAGEIWHAVEMRALARTLEYCIADHDDGGAEWVETLLANVESGNVTIDQILDLAFDIRMKHAPELEQYIEMAVESLCW